MQAIQTSLGVTGSSEALIVLLFIIFILARRIMRQRNGTRYSIRSILTTPIIYLILTALLMVGESANRIAVIVTLMLLGLAAGLILGKRSDIFEKEGKVMYRRSTEVTFLWVIGYVIRVGIEFLSASPTIIFYADILLAVSAGLLLGETVVLYRNYNNKYKKKRTVT
jgi:hypothetical protein